MVTAKDLGLFEGKVLRDPPDVGEAPPYEDRYPLVLGFLGLRGNAKSASMAALSVMCYQVGLNIWHNGGLRFGELLDVDKFFGLELRDGFVVLDEVHRWADSRTGMKLFNRDLANVLLQIRKLNLSIAWATHRQDLVDVRLRKATDRTIECHYDKAAGDNVLWVVRDPNMMDTNDPYQETLRVFRGISKYWKYFDSETLFDSMDSQANSKDRARNDAIRKTEAVQTTVTYMYRRLGKLQASAGDVMECMARLKDMPQVGPTEIGKILGFLGVPQHRTNKARLYQLAEYCETRGLQIGYKSE